MSTLLIHVTLINNGVYRPGQHKLWRFSLASHRTPCSNVDWLTVLEAIQTLPLAITGVPHMHYRLRGGRCQYLTCWIPVN